MSQGFKTIGMIGIGQLGLPIATNLINAGYRVVGYRRSDREEFQRCGGEALNSPCEVAQAADAILLCLPNENAQLEVFEGESGLLQNLRAGTVFVEMGTYSREFKLAQAARIVAQGGRVLEAEVSGSPPMVAQRTAALYIGGTTELLDECRPLLNAITAQYVHLGDYGSAVAMKLIANYLLTIHTLAAAEAINLGARAGLAPQLVADVIKLGAGNSAMFTIRAPLMASRKFSPALGSFSTLEKYLKLGEALTHQVGSASPLFSTAAPYFYRALEGGMQDLDIAAVIELLENDNAHTRTEKANNDR